MLFRAKPQASTTSAVFIISLITLLLILTLSLTYHKSSVMLPFQEALPASGAISPILHSQNLSHGSFHNKLTKPYLLSLVTTKPSEVVVIIGLEHGGEAVTMAKTHSVYAIEPLPNFVERFRKRHSRLTNVTVYQVAASDTDGELNITYRDIKETVSARRAESVLPPNLDVAVVSVDIQGAEYAALKGLGKILDRTNSVWVEVSCKYGETMPTDLLHFLDERFLLFDFVPWGRIKGVDDIWDRQQFQWGQRPDRITEWVRWFCDARAKFSWLQTDFVGVSRALLKKRPEILAGMREVGERNCEKGCHFRDLAARTVR